MMRFLFLIALLMAFPAQAQEKLDQHDFARLPVQHEGRIKPIDSFARGFLSLISGHESLGGMDAESWLAETLFDPAQALHRPAFRIFRPALLDLPVREKKYYSYAELVPALQAKAGALKALMQTEEKNWSEDQKELARLQDASILYTQLLRSFSSVLPLNITPPDFLKIPQEKPFTLQEYKRHAQQLQIRVAQIIKRKGGDPSRYTDEERKITEFAFEMQILEQGGANNVLFRVLPGQDKEWFSPWALTEQGEGSPRTAQYLALWQDMALAYLEQDAAAWKQATQKTLAASAEFSPAHKIEMEMVYNTYHPLTMAMALYFLAFAVLVVFSLQTSGPWRLLSFGILTAGCIVHGIAILLRVLILSRPPVGTLYESILFVALVCVIAGLVMEYWKKDGSGLLTGTVSGLLLLFTAQGFTEDDTMKMLVAVLNTNFWLGTHVLCITTGYAWCVIASILAHIWLVREAFGKDAAKFTAPVKTIGLVALLFTTIGTILGGIWADQSWGRFWGWDPKENGALLIVLWLIWLLHGQVSGHIRRVFFMAGMAALSVIVALAWFGVNLLNVGLHSYGFITGVAGGLGAFCAAEMLVIGYLAFQIYKKGARA